MKNKNRNKWNKKDMKFIFTCHFLDAGGALWRMYRSSRPYISALTFLARRCSLTRTTTSTPRLLPHGLNEYGRIGTRATDGRSDGRTIPII